MSRGEGKDNRERLVKLAIQSPEKAAAELKAMAAALSECKSTSDTVFALSEIFCVSEVTIYRDFRSDSN